MRVLHCADLHLERAFPGMPAPWPQRRRQAIRDALRRIVALAAEHRVDALTIAGDLYEDDRARGDTGAFLAEAFASLPCPVLIAPGNHDYWHPGGTYARQSWPANVHVFSTPHLQAVAVGGTRIFGAAHVQPKGSANFLERVRIPDGPPAVALFHGAEVGQLRFEDEGKGDHAPFAEAEIERAGFAYALVGHYHRPRVTPRLCYPGNPEPLAFGEAGGAGAALVDLAELPPRVTIHRVATFQTADVTVDVSDCTHRDAVVERVRQALPDGDRTAVRVRCTGELPPTVVVSARQVASALEHQRCVAIDWAVRPTLDLADLLNAPDVRGEFVRALHDRPDADSPLVQRALVAGLRALAGEDPGLR
ncbi:MAG TPA: DNA repair exonuclease [Candidatus Micrarchaeia archaeon]|nr:DNA repair exonuclease [Candidatus Micrarchaeia archaeon]